MYHSKSCDTLRSLTRERGLDSFGTKDDLITRLCLYDEAYSAECGKSRSMLKQRILEYSMSRRLSAAILEKLAWTSGSKLAQVSDSLDSINGRPGFSPVVQDIEATISAILNRGGIGRRGNQTQHRGKAINAPRPNPRTVSLTSSPETNSSSFSLTLVVPSSPIAFPQFPKIPTELRLKVWSYCLPGERVVQFYHFDGHIRSCQPPPVLLQVCGESRREALRTLKICFATRDRRGGAYFNPSLDIFHIGLLSQQFFGHPEHSNFMDFLISTVKEEDLRFIQHLVITTSWESDRFLWNRTFPNLRFVKTLAGLQKLTFCFAERGAEMGGELALGIDLGGFEPEYQIHINSLDLPQRQSLNLQKGAFLRKPLSEIRDRDSI